MAKTQLRCTPQDRCRKVYLPERPDYDCDGTPPENYYTKADREYRELHR